jgi:hypothetical protein
VPSALVTWVMDCGLAALSLHRRVSEETGFAGPASHGILSNTMTFEMKALTSRM